MGFKFIIHWLNPRPSPPYATLGLHVCLTIILKLGTGA